MDTRYVHFIQFLSLQDHLPLKSWQDFKPENSKIVSLVLWGCLAQTAQATTFRWESLLGPFNPLCVLLMKEGRHWEERVMCDFRTTSLRSLVLRILEFQLCYLSNKFKQLYLKTTTENKNKTKNFTFNIFLLIFSYSK